jgi:4-amino-4-deoxy-L-arabinose transferase-like glycosyltransferase
LSYFDNSGMVAYLIRLSTTAFGASTPLSVRMPFLVLSAGTSFLLYQISVLLFTDRGRALLVVLLFNIIPMGLLGGSAAVHDNALIFFWVLTMWATARFLKSGNPQWFYAMGIAVGLAILSKYTGVLAGAGLLAFFGWTGPLRPWFGRKEPWIAAAIAVLFTAPILWWNVTHEWASLHHVLFIGSGSSSVGHRFADGLGYHLAQFLLVSPLLYVALVTALCVAAVRNLFRPKPEQALLLCFSLPLVLFGLQAFKGHVEANWGVMGYAAAGILAVEHIFQAHGRGRPGLCKRYDGRYLKVGIAVSIIMGLVAVLHAWIGLLPAAVEQKIAKEDRIVWETHGWAKLGKHVADLTKPGDILAADSYQLCALLEFNVPGQPAVRYLAPWKRPTQFDVREPSFDNLTGKSILYVSPVPLEPTSPARASIYENFRRVEKLPSYYVRYHESVIREIHVYRGEAFNPFQPRRLEPRSLLYKDY